MKAVSLHCPPPPLLYAIVTFVGAFLGIFPTFVQAQELECGWQYHFNQLDGRWEQWCLSSYERRIFNDEQISVVAISRSKARPDANMPAVCMYPIPCDRKNDYRDASYEMYTDWKMSVCGSVSIDAKVKLGVDLLQVLGLEIGVNVSIEGCAEYIQHEGYSDTVRINQQDCYNELYRFWKTTNRVQGTVTEIEEYQWSLLNHGFYDENGVWRNCYGGTVTTRCAGGSASGSAKRDTAAELELEVTECCTPLDGVPPCCGRACPP